jgi:hypothetical protein
LKQFYNFITYLFFPGTFALAGFLLPAILLPAPLEPWHFLPVVVFCYILFPILGILLLIKMGYLKDLHVYQREMRNRSYPLAIAGATLGFVYIFFGSEKISFYSELRVLWSLSISIVLFFIWVINAGGLKVSAHLAGVSGFAALAIVLFRSGIASPVWVFISLALVALVYAARKGLSAHSHIELIAGFCLGFITTFAVFTL